MTVWRGIGALIGVVFVFGPVILAYAVWGLYGVLPVLTLWWLHGWRLSARGEDG